MVRRDRSPSSFLHQEVESSYAIERLDGLRRVGWDLELIVVDDDSCDGTVELIESMSTDWIRLVVRTEDRGLSTPS